MLVYALPIGNKQHTLWSPQPQIAWGELQGGNTVTLLTGSNEAIDLEEVRCMLHDNLFRPSVMRASRKTQMGGRRSAGYMMIWGAIWLIGMDNPLEDILSGLYLLLGLPIFMKISAAKFTKRWRGVIARFKEITHFPEIVQVYSPRLTQLEEYIDEGGFEIALQHLDILGFAHLREFYKRAAWSTRWTSIPPTGLGTISSEEE